jgi:hypothetical protein
MSADPHAATEQAPVVCKTCRLGTLSPTAMESTAPVLTMFLGYPCTICASWQTCPVSPTGAHTFVTAAGVPGVDCFVFKCVHCGTLYAFAPLARPTDAEHHIEMERPDEVHRVH